jgi:hypothetical protein
MRNPMVDFRRTWGTRWVAAGLGAGGFGVCGVEFGDLDFFGEA